MGPLAAYGAATLLVAVSFSSYTRHFSPVWRWQADRYDPADYRFVAERFWHVPFSPATYGLEINGAWGEFLRIVPFRRVGLGTSYLLVGYLRSGSVPRTTPDVIATGMLLARIEKVLLACALFTLFAAVRREWGTSMALLALAVTAFPPRFWRMSDDFLVEPVLRVCFLLLLACAVAVGGRRSVPGLLFATLALWLIAAHLTVQWVLAGFLLLPIILLEARSAGTPSRIKALLCLAVVLVPLSLSAVNWVGWRTPTVSPGVAIHVHLKYGDEVLRGFCRAREQDGVRPGFCDESRPRLAWWAIHVGADVRREGYDAFDRYARRYVLTHPGQTLREFWEGIKLAQSIPGLEVQWRDIVRLVPTPARWAPYELAVDLAVWPLLSIGLLFARTRLPCATALVLWIVPAVGNVFSVFDLRYEQPMAGIGLASSFQVLALLVSRLTGSGATAREVLPP